MKVVIDANVLISGLFVGGVPARVLAAWTEGRVRLVVAPDILSEYRRVGFELAKGRAPLLAALDALLPSSPCTPPSSMRRGCPRQFVDQYLRGERSNERCCSQNAARRTYKVHCHLGCF